VNNLQMFFAKANARQKDPVDEVLDSFFTYVDANVKVEPLPNLTAENIVGRARMLLSESQDKPLASLAELLYYYKQDLITSEQLAAVYGKLIGAEDGPQLATGTPEERKAILERMLNDAAAELEEGQESKPPEFFGS
jgi:hypothetical protein